jgi:hypothetical protein
MTFLSAGVSKDDVQSSAEVTAEWLSTTEEELEARAERRGNPDPHSDEAARAQAAAEQLGGQVGR